MPHKPLDHQQHQQHQQHHEHASGCAACDAGPFPADRRRFLRDAFLAAAGAMVALGASRSTALAMPLRFTSALGRGSGDAHDTRRYALPSADGAQIDRDNEVILVRWQNVVYAFNLSCPHQHTALRWDDADHRFQCPKHHSQYQPDGTFIKGRATRGMDRFAVRRDGDAIEIDLDKMFKNDEDPAGWSAAAVKLA